jgi:hypothetical protein
MRIGRGQLAVAAVAALALFRLGRFALGVWGLAVELGPLWALAAALLAVGWRAWLPLRIGVFLGAMALWHWPWFAALALAAPRLLLMLPGLIASALARLRHPRARWPAAWSSGF